jgi:hypothetical protein
LHRDVLLFWANWRELTAEFGQSKVLDGRPFPSVTVVEHQQGTIDFPKFGSNMTAAERMLELHVERIRRPLYEDDCQQGGARGGHRASPPASTGRATPLLPTAAAPPLPTAKAAQAAVNAANLKEAAAKSRREAKETAKKPLVTPDAKAKRVKDLRDSKEGAGRSPAGKAISWATFLAFVGSYHPEDCVRQWRGRLKKEGCHMKMTSTCKFKHAELADKEELFKARARECGLALDGGYEPSAEDLTKARGKKPKPKEGK